MDKDHASTTTTQATGIPRLFNRIVHALMHVLPGRSRRALGWWSWRDVLETRYEYGVVLANGFKGEGPVQGLFRRGISLPTGAIAWPREFNDFHKAWNWDCNWHRVPALELTAWASIWKSLPGEKGQRFLNTALVGMAQAGEADNVRILIEHGARPQGHSPRTTPEPPLMRQLLGAPMEIERMLKVLKHVCQVSSVSWDDWVSNSPRPQRRSAQEMQAWQDSGLPLPHAEAALLHALAWFDDPAVDNPVDCRQAIMAVRWFKDHGHLPANARQRMLQQFLLNARPGHEEYYQTCMRAWADELLDQGLPSRPPSGPTASASTPMPWSHWAAIAVFPENLPDALRDVLFSEPDAWTAIDRDGRTALDIHLEIARDDLPEWRQPGQERLLAWLGSRQLARDVVSVSLAPAPRPAPRL